MDKTASLPRHVAFIMDGNGRRAEQRHKPRPEGHRAGGEFLTSNILIWRSAYSEYYFTPVLWSDFNEAELDKAMLACSQRKRRFGGLESKAECSEKDS